MFRNCIVLLILILANLPHLFAQVTDTIPKKTGNTATIRTHSSRTATIMSAVLPGLGQIYNRRYWKLPIIYGGAIGLGAWYTFNSNKFENYKAALKYRTDNDPKTIDEYANKYSIDNLNTLQEYYHSYRDLAIICMVGLYILNVVDANVDAHLFSYDVSDNLSLWIEPYIDNAVWTKNPAAGLSFKLNF